MFSSCTPCGYKGESGVWFYPLSMKYYKVVFGKRHAPAALLPGNRPSKPLYMRL
jgi:hypothetical protein